LARAAGDFEQPAAHCLLAAENSYTATTFDTVDPRPNCTFYGIGGTPKEKPAGILGSTDGFPEWAAYSLQRSQFY